MQIAFEGIYYTSKNLTTLEEKYPESKKLLQFINDWLSNKSTFEFQTSGSTGIPKTITIKREQIASSAQATSQFLGLQSTDKTLVCLDPNFIASIMMVARCLVNDMDLIIQRPNSNPLKGEEQSIDFASFVPLQIYKMIEDGNIDQLDSIRNILIGGAPLSKKALDKLSQISTNIFITYGMTETVSHVALMPVGDKGTKSYYDVLPDISIEQDDEQCLKIYGTVTKNKWIQTNDIVEIKNEKQFEWIGRRDDVINSGGIKIHPSQLEKTIEKFIGTPFIISWQPNEKLGKECILITENYNVPALELKKIQNSITNQFSKYHVPKKVITIEHFIRTDSGKIKREEIRQAAILTS